MHSMLLRLALLLALTAGLPACAARTATAMADDMPEATAAEQPLLALPVGTRWRLAGSERDVLQVDDAARVTLRVEDGRLFGDSGCNQYSVGVQLDAVGLLTMDPVVSTKRGCIGPAGDIEKAYYEALGNASWFTRDGDTLVLWLHTGDSLRFAPAPPEAM